MKGSPSDFQLCFSELSPLRLISSPVSPEPPIQDCGEAGGAQPGRGRQALVCLFQFFSDAFPPQYSKAAEGFTGALWNASVNGCLLWLWDLKKNAQFCIDFYFFSITCWPISCPHSRLRP